MKRILQGMTLAGMALIILGLVILLRPTVFAGWVSVGAGLALVATGILRWMDTRVFWRMPLGDNPLLLGLLGLLLLVNPLLPFQGVGIILGIWGVVTGAESLASAWRLGKLEVAWDEMALRGMMLLALGLLLLAKPAIVSLAIGIPAGLFLILLGAWLLRKRF